MGATARMVDLTNVKESSGINKKRIPSGDYAAIITKVEDSKAKDGTDMYFFHIKVKEYPAIILPYYCKLQENQLWKLRNIFIAAGKVVPKKKLKVDPNTIVGKLIGITVEDSEHEGKEQSEISGVFPAADLDEASLNASGDDNDEPDTSDTDDDDIDDLDTPEASEPAPSADEEAEADEDEDEPAAAEEADPYADLDRAAIKARIKAAQPDFRVLKSHTDDDLRAALKKIEAASTSSDEEDLTDIDIDDL